MVGSINPKRYVAGIFLHQQIVNKNLLSDMSLCHQGAAPDWKVCKLRG